MTVYRLYKREVTNKEREDVQLINLQQILEKIQQAETDGLVRLFLGPINLDRRLFLMNNLHIFDLYKAINLT